MPRVPTMPTERGLLFKTVQLKIVRIIGMIYKLDLSKRTEALQILHLFLLNVFIFPSFAFTEEMTNFIYISNLMSVWPTQAASLLLLLHPVF